jgi:small-conductance mechanosensitive channel
MTLTPFSAVYPLAGALVGAVSGLAARRLLIPRLVRLAARSATKLDDILLESVRGPLALWGALAGLHMGLGLGDWPPSALATARHVVLVALGLSVTWTAARITGALVDVAGANGTALPSARILKNLAQAVVGVVGVLATLDTIGVSVAPLLTALGVGGLAVGLALQDTLSNLFAGFHLLVTRQVRPGDFVRLGTGEEGYVQDITWRYTTVRQLPNNLVIVPNAKLASAVTANFSLPDQEQAVLVEVGVGYDDDLDIVERVTVEVATDVMKTVEGGVAGFTPFIRLHTFGDNAIQFTTIMRATHYTDQYLVKHEFVRRLHRRYQEAGITIPYPQRTVHMAGGGS